MLVKTNHFYIEKFVECFGGKADDVRVFFAPGRVNLIGEHTDYNGGYVFPAALTYGIWAFIRKREDDRVRLYSLNYESRIEENHVNSLVFKKENDWANYPHGVLNEFIQRGESLGGMDILYYGNIPNGAGLSSSAAIEIVTAIGVNSIFGLSYTMKDLIQLSQRAENQFVGVNCGIMDQFAVGMGKENHAIFLNCQTLDYSHVRMNIEGYKLVITNTNKSRGLTDSKYNERRNECEQGVDELRLFIPQITSLGDVTLDVWNWAKDHLKNETIRQRLEHVIQENHRVLQAKQVLSEHRIEEFGKLMIQSHLSLRDLYQVTGKELDALFTISRQIEGCIGTRMTGAGFGGCTVSLVKEDAVERFKSFVDTKYEEEIGYPPSFYVCDLGHGAQEITQEVEKWPS